MSRKKKITFILGEFPVISESWLQEKLLHVYLIANNDFDFSFLSIARGSFAADERLRRVEYLDIPKNKIKKVLFGVLICFKYLFIHPVALYKLLKTQGYKNLIFTYAHYLEFYYKILKTSDIIHCHFGMIGNRLFAVEKVVGSKAKIIVSFYGQDVERYPSLRGNDYYAYMIERANKIISMTDFMKGKLVDLGFSGEKIVVNRSGVDIKKYSYNEKKYESGECLNVVSVGRIVEKKGFDDLLRAINIVTQKYKNISVKILGGAPESKRYLEKELLKMRDGFGLNDVVEFCGMVDHEKINEYFKKSHLMLQLSKIDVEKDTEGLPFVILEGQSSGLPVVSTRHAGIPEGVAESRSALLVDEGDYESAAQKILYFIENPHEINTFSNNARKNIIENFNIGVKTDELVGEYIKILK